MTHHKKSAPGGANWNSFLTSQHPAFPGRFEGVPPEWIVENVFDWLLNQNFRIFMFDRFECDQHEWTGYCPASLVWTYRAKCDDARMTLRGCREIALGRETRDKHVICDKGEAFYTIGRLAFVPRAIHIESAASKAAGVQEVA